MCILCRECIECFIIHSIECIRNIYDLCQQCQYTWHLMVWLKSWVSAFQNFFGIENRLNIKKVMGRNVYMSFVSTVSTYIALNALHALILCLDSVNIHSIQNAQCISCFDPSVFSFTLARSPMASRSYRWASDFLNYSPRLASDILVENFFYSFFLKIVSPDSHYTLACQRLIW